MMSLWIFVAFVVFGASTYGAAGQCTQSGRIANEVSEQCRGYTTCIVGGATPIQYHLACPPGFIFHHIDTQCTNATNYRCLPAESCSEVGSFPAPSPSDAPADCSWFVWCFPGLAGLSARLAACPPRTLFHPQRQICVDPTQYKCPHPPTTTTIAPDAVTEPSAYHTTSTEAHTNNSAHNTARHIFTYIMLSTIMLSVLNSLSCLAF